MKKEFERKVLGIFSENDRLKELQEKAHSKGLKGDEVYEFIWLDRKELQNKLDKMTMKYNYAMKHYLSESAIAECECLVNENYWKAVNEDEEPKPVEGIEEEWEW